MLAPKGDGEYWGDTGVTRETERAGGYLREAGAAWTGVEELGAYRQGGLG